MLSHPDIDRLATYRLEHDLTFDALAAQMARAGCPINTRSLAWALSKRLQTLPRERTIYRISKFVATLDAAPSRRAPKRRRRVA